MQHRPPASALPVIHATGPQSTVPVATLASRQSTVPELAPASARRGLTSLSRQTPAYPDPLPWDPSHEGSKWGTAACGTSRVDQHG